MIRAPQSAARPPLSVLDLVPVSEGQGVGEAIADSMRGARAADRLGYHRYWYAEHHNTISVASSATALLIGQAAQLTERIRVGSGGIMLPNHAPLAVIEQFGTLVHQYGDRIDLGLGRAPGTDPITAQMLSRTSAEPEAFMRSVAAMRTWSGPGSADGVRVEAPVATGTEVPMWVLGSTANGARLAAQLGLPFAVASHFAPFQYEQAIRVYRDAFDPSASTAQISAPRVMVAANAVVCESDEEAQRQFQTLREMFVGIVTGQRQKLQPPRDLTGAIPAELLASADRTLSVSAVGSAQTAAAQLERIARATDADELILTFYAHDPEVRLRGMELLASEWGLS